MDGILLVDKPEGWTSHDVVAKVRGILRQARSQKPKAKSSDEELLASSSQLSALSPKVKVGHTGTLDPAATGLMILVIGKYTKKAGEFSKTDKTYEAEVTLGRTSTTADREGTITDYSGQVTADSKRPSEEEVRKVLHTFVGEISQTPPAFSAIKVDGQRAYKMARAGKEVKIEPRKATIYSIENIVYKYPKISFTVSVSSGTYIRSLAEDIGKKLGTGAYMSALRRTRVGKFDIKNAVKIDNLALSTIECLLRK